MFLLRRSPKTGKNNTMRIDISPEELDDGMFKIACGCDVSNAFPEQTEEEGMFLAYGLVSNETTDLSAEDIINELEEFRDMLDQWRSGKPVVKLCYGLGNNHMKALDKILP